MHPLIDMDWQSRSKILQPEISAWLFKPGSLSRHLQALGVFEVKVLEEKHGADPQCFSYKNKHSISSSFSSALFTRLALLKVNNEAVVLARSLVEEEACQSVWKEIHNLGSTSIGTLLFHPAITRGPFEWGQVKLSSFPDADISDKTLTPLRPNFGKMLWARRSNFYRNGKPLMVSECFLPSFWSLVQTAKKT